MPKRSMFADIAHLIFGNTILIAYICLAANGMRTEALIAYGVFFVFEGLWRIRDKIAAAPVAFIIAGALEMASGVCRLLSENDTLTALTEYVDTFAFALIFVAIFEKTFLDLTKNIKDCL